MLVAACDVVRARSAALWGAASAAAAGVAALTLPVLAAAPHALADRPDFDEVLVTGCSAASLLAVGWLWLITTEVVVQVLAAGGRGADVVVRRPGALRLLLLAACGVIALSGPAAAATPGLHESGAAAQRDPVAWGDRPSLAPRQLAGLPLPDRATSDGAPPAQRPGATSVAVRRGDSLWAIAEAHLGPSATGSQIAAYARQVYDHNSAVIGTDPDLILPGQVLELPPPD